MISEEDIKAAREAISGKTSNEPYPSKETPIVFPKALYDKLPSLYDKWKEEGKIICSSTMPVDPSPAPHWNGLKPKR